MSFPAAWMLAFALVTADTPAWTQPPEPDHSAYAFGGLLSGTDRGEWIGRLQFKDASGNVRVLLEENVLGIVENTHGVFVFTGLAHLGLNEGQMYRINRDERGLVTAALVRRLPGAPSQVIALSKSKALFLVFTGKFDAKGMLIFECYSLNGDSISRGTGCPQGG
ncbi:hypothetical protein ACI6Q5_14845 [Xanthomonas codiaei]|uniref:Uncharacterized protein n=1 Tax=Xanthomonas codiaei TaxID=56463 RepID=A0A2S7CFG8_9XANT|nr:hypothetical protein [Xanthomonas codiaei]PPU60310.1 hypothetical protein XcodCFBP4690_17990 [Xanthomonas codiaei]